MTGYYEIITRKLSVDRPQRKLYTLPNALLHRTHWAMINFTVFLPFRIQYFDRISVRVFLTLLWPTLSWALSIICVVRGWSLLSSTACLEAYDKFASASRPLHLQTPCESRNRLNCPFQVPKFLSWVRADWNSTIHSLFASVESCESAIWELLSSLLSTLIKTWERMLSLWKILTWSQSPGISSQLRYQCGDLDSIECGRFHAGPPLH